MIYLPLVSRPRASQKNVKAAIEKFARRGKSGPHEQGDKLLPYVLNHCVNREIGFDLVYRPGEGYFVKKAGK